MKQNKYDPTVYFKHTPNNDFSVISSTSFCRSIHLQAQYEVWSQAYLLGNEFMEEFSSVYLVEVCI